MIISRTFPAIVHEKYTAATLMSTCDVGCSSTRQCRLQCRSPTTHPHVSKITRSHLLLPPWREDRDQVDHHLMEGKNKRRHVEAWLQLNSKTFESTNEIVKAQHLQTKQARRKANQMCLLMFIAHILSLYSHCRQVVVNITGLIHLIVVRCDLIDSRIQIKIAMKWHNAV